MLLREYNYSRKHIGRFTVVTGCSAALMSRISQRATEVAAPATE